MGPQRQSDQWQPDLLGEGYEQLRLDLGEDPDGQGAIEAVLVRRNVREGERVDGAVLYVHGFSDYFFQTGLADFFAARGLAFFGLDLRKSGRARKPHQTAHFATDLVHYDEELELSLQQVSAAAGGGPVVVVAHSTGGLITPLWLDRRRRRDAVAPVAGLVLNSPWFDLQGGRTPRANAFLRGPVSRVVRGLARVRPHQALNLGVSSAYGDSLHVTGGGQGEWEYDVAMKPMEGDLVTVGWLAAVRRGQARLHRGLDVGVPALVLRSDKTLLARRWSEECDRADVVLDVHQIQKWSGCLGNETTVVPVPDARHDVFLSIPAARERAYQVVDRWLAAHALGEGADAGAR
ncbi:alpha/beta hydrolase [Nocardioides solisilvae]|uniref:alpha/beta hydrolase n=1 Tax=Nocardioides solisilvae TaxID=1542435 RepID=UPI000D7487C4|nr:alpha/beta hydrolase [Nocardioides solisilvae]